MTARALEGLRIIEFCDELGSYCGRLLADLGADVIKVEPPGGGQERHTPPFYHDTVSPETSLAFWVHNTSKRSVVLDLDTAEGQRAAHALALTADAIIEDFSPGHLAARGLGYETLAAERPALVYTSITGWGQTGPHAGWASSEILAQATAGLMALAGDPEDAPQRIYGNQADMGASVHAAQGTLLALLHAEATGEGQHVDVSAQEAMLIAQETAMQQWDMQKKLRMRSGKGFAASTVLGFTPPAQGIYPTRDGWAMLYVVQMAGADFPEVVDWMREHGMQADLDEEPYASIVEQLRMPWMLQVAADPVLCAEMTPHINHIDEVLQAFIASLTSKQAYEEGQRRRLLVGNVSTPKDLAEDTQLRARDWFTTLQIEGIPDEVPFIGVPYHLSRTPAAIGRPPRLGEHTGEVLAALQEVAR